MTETYGIFDRAEGDAEGAYQYSAAVLSDVIAKLIRDGVVHGSGDSLAVSASDPAAMSVSVGSGTALIQGRYYQNSAALTLTIPTADSSYPRIDRVVVRLNTTPNRTVVAAVVQGSPAVSPAAPALTRTAETYEISLAQVRVEAGVTSIAGEKVTDEREDATLCGPAAPAYVPSPQLDVTGDIDADGHQITGLGTPSDDADAATKGYADAEIAAKIAGFGISQIAIDADKDWNGKNLTNVGRIGAKTSLVLVGGDLAIFSTSTTATFSSQVYGTGHLKIEVAAPNTTVPFGYGTRTYVVLKNGVQIWTQSQASEWDGEDNRWFAISWTVSEDLSVVAGDVLTVQCTAGSGTPTMTIYSTPIAALLPVVS